MFCIATDCFVLQAGLSQPCASAKSLSFYRVTDQSPWLQIHDGRRVTSATSYLAEAFNRSNLDIIVNTRVTKVLPVGYESGKPVMRGVEIAQTAGGELRARWFFHSMLTCSSTGRTHTLKAREEVVLSAGSIKTPHIRSFSTIPSILTDIG